MHKFEVDDRWFLPMELYDFIDITYILPEACDFPCEAGTKYVKHYVVEIEGIDFNIPYLVCVEVPHDFMVDERIKDIHRHVEEDLMQGGVVVRDYRQLAFDIHGVDIFSKETSGKHYEIFKKYMTAYGK